MAGTRRPVTTIKEQVYQIIKEDICNGVYPPGYWLQETDLSAALSVSRSPIREALRQLVADGLVVEYPNRGVFVKEYTQKDIEDIFDLRIILESYAIRRSGQNLTSAYAEKLNAFMDTLIYYHKAADLQNYINADTGLHQLIIELSGNNLVISTYERVYSMVQQFRIYSLTSKERFDESVTEHTKIIQNILRTGPRTDHCIFKQKRCSPLACRQRRASFLLMEKYCQNTDQDGTKDRYDNGSYAPCLQAGLDIHSTEVGYHVEITVV